MDILQIIYKKRTKQTLSEQEIYYFVNEFVKGEKVKDYQASALLMAILLNGFDDDETYYLTKAMLESGKTMSFNGIEGPIIDKHSTGGVADTVSLILLPICASLGIKVAKLSGGALGHTGGTVDKLASIKVSMDWKPNKDLNLLKKVGMFIMKQTNDIVPADKVLYELRSVTDTVECLPLVAASVISKKLALKTDHIFIDLKFGEGAFCKDINQAVQLANIMINLCKRFKRKVNIHVTNMSEPLGSSIGNAIEVKAAMDFLDGKSETPRLNILVERFIIDILLATKKTKTAELAKKMYLEVLNNKKALNQFKKWAVAQGSSMSILNGDFFLPKYKLDIKTNRTGYLLYKSCRELGYIANDLGAGRHNKEEAIDFQAGIHIKFHNNEFVNTNQVLATLYANKPIPKSFVNRYLNNIVLTKKKHKIKESQLIAKVLEG